MTKIYIALIAVLALGGGTYVAYEKKIGPFAEMSATNSAEISWKFESQGDDLESGAPLTRVSVTIGGVLSDLGLFTGSCSQISNSSWGLVEGEVDGAICWWAGGGEEIGIFEENGELVIKKGQLDEGSAEVAGVRGNFEVLVPRNETTDTDNDTSTSGGSSATSGGSTAPAGGSGGGSAGVTVYTSAQVALHATGTSCWTIIDGSVYDLTEWIKKHPGGASAILKLCGRDGTEIFHGQHGTAAAQANILATYKLGSLSR